MKTFQTKFKQKQFLHLILVNDCEQFSVSERALEFSKFQYQNVFWKKILFALPQGILFLEKDLVASQLRKIKKTEEKEKRKKITL